MSYPDEGLVNDVSMLYREKRKATFLKSQSANTNFACCDAESHKFLPNKETEWTIRLLGPRLVLRCGSPFSASSSSRFAFRHFLYCSTCVHRGRRRGESGWRFGPSFFHPACIRAYGIFIHTNINTRDTHLNSLITVSRTYHSPLDCVLLF